MVARYGRDIAGALVVLDADQDLEGIHDDSELSIAGLQNKLLLVRLDDGGWARPVAGSPSTHILKLDSQSHPGVVAPRQRS
jgi:hypothetical protein